MELSGAQPPSCTKIPQRLACSSLKTVLAVLVSHNLLINLHHAESDIMAGGMTLDHNDLGLAGSLFDGCLNLFITLRKITHGSIVLSEIQNKLLSKQLEQFLLWGDGFGASKGDLDAVLIQPDSSHLNTLILQLLGAIGHTLIDSKPLVAARPLDACSISF